MKVYTIQKIVKNNVYTWFFAYQKTTVKIVIERICSQTYSYLFNVL